nr:MAG: hypothetical protein 2 [Leviviridae sp.]
MVDTVVLWLIKTTGFFTHVTTSVVSLNTGDASQCSVTLSLSRSTRLRIRFRGLRRVPTVVLLRRTMGLSSFRFLTLRVRSGLDTSSVSITPRSLLTRFLRASTSRLRLLFTWWWMSRKRVTPSPSRSRSWTASRPS